ncbi:MAG: 2-dehydropantoate 2-reductase [Pseudomonadota bacterium]
MKVAVVGPGAMGCLLAVFLAKSGREVLLLDHRPERAETMARDGLFIEGHPQAVKVRVTIEPQAAAEADLVLICVKAYQTREAVRPLAPYVRPEARVLTLQNGVGNVEALAEVFGPERVWGGVTAQGATVLGPGRVRHAGRGDTVVAALAGAVDEARLAQAAEMFNQADLPTRVGFDVQSLIWSKLIINVGINPLTALTRLKNGQLLDFPGTRAIMAAAVAEAEAVAEALEVRLIYPDPLSRVKEVASATAGNIASMLQDVLAHRPTEIDFINGAVAARGKELGLPTPVNDTLTRLVKTIESSYSLSL